MSLSPIVYHGFATWINETIRDQKSVRKNPAQLKHNVFLLANIRSVCVPMAEQTAQNSSRILGITYVLARLFLQSRAFRNEKRALLSERTIKRFTRLLAHAGKS